MFLMDSSAHCRRAVGPCALSRGPCRARVRSSKLHCIPVPTNILLKENRAFSASTTGTEHPVEVRVYNIDRYGLASQGDMLLKKKFDAIWHCGIAAYGKEYWFDHQVNCEQLNDVQYAFGFGPTYVFDLGKTTISEEDFESWLYSVMTARYSIDSYDFEKHNCHHFANELAIHLTGNGIPDWCVKFGEEALSELDKSDAARVRWASNKVARIMMVTWGRYNKARFVKKEKQRFVREPQQGAQIA